jgi:3D (Asp-Asp-Asp) domain-containing protein
MAKSLLGGGAAAALLSVSLIFYADPSIAQPLADTAHKSLTQQKSADTAGRALTNPTLPEIIAPTIAAITAEDADKKLKRVSFVAATPTSKNNSPSALLSPRYFVATAYSLRGRTASGRFVTKGIIAADHRVLPLGTRVHVQSGSYSGEYLVADTGGAIRGRKIDIWVPSTREAMLFGRQKVKLTILSPATRRRAQYLRPTLSN